MKPVFKCDYCSKMGTEEEIREHEEKCPDNYDKKDCNTCIHRKINMKKEWYECQAGKEIPKGKVYVFCDKYERKIKTNEVSDLFSNLLAL
ncbi:MAG: hypothetical protein PUC23_03535 [bacterium]|nr:hypothetical protein [bacterium]